MEKILIEDNVESMNTCTNCGNHILDSFPTCHNTEFQKDTNKRELFLIWSCISCNTEMISHINK